MVERRARESARMTHRTTSQRTSERERVTTRTEWRVPKPSGAGAPRN